MRIGIISSGTVTDRIPPTYGGGIQKYLWNLARELNNLGHEVHIFASHQPNQLKQEVQSGIYIHRISRIIKNKNFATLFFGFKTLLRILKIQKTKGVFHILHAQSRISGLVVRALYPFHIPFIFTAHNWDIALTLPGTIFSLLPYSLLLLIEKIVYKKSDRIISLTNYFQKILLNRYNIPQSKIEIIPNMVTLSEIEKKTTKLHPPIKKIGSESFLLFIGRLEKEKGLEFLLRTFKSITNQDENLKLVVVGGGTLERDLIRTRMELKLRKKVHILGKIHEDQLRHLIQTAEALILPSQFEIMPTVILEAWASECPVIVNNYYGVQALIHHKETGLVFQRSKTDQLTSLVNELRTKKDLRQKLIQNSKMQLRSHYVTIRVVEKIVKMYYNLLNRCN